MELGDLSLHMKLDWLGCEGEIQLSHHPLEIYQNPSVSQLPPLIPNCYHSSKSCSILYAMERQELVWQQRNKIL